MDWSLVIVDILFRQLTGETHLFHLSHLIVARHSLIIGVLLTPSVSQVGPCCLASLGGPPSMDMGSSTDFQPFVHRLLSRFSSLSDWLSLSASQVHGLTVTPMDSVVQKSDRSTVSLNLRCKTVVVALFSRSVDEPNMTHPSGDFLATTYSTCFVWPTCMYA